MSGDFAQRDGHKGIAVRDWISRLPQRDRDPNTGRGIRLAYAAIGRISSGETMTADHAHALTAAVGVLAFEVTKLRAKVDRQAQAIRDLQLLRTATRR